MDLINEIFFLCFGLDWEIMFFLIKWIILFVSHLIYKMISNIYFNMLIKFMIR